MAQTTTRDIILRNADYHTRLTEALSKVDNAPAALAQHKAHLRELEAQLAESAKKVEVLAGLTQKERKEHESLRDSKARKLAAKFSGKMGKFEANKEKEEREYVEALQNEMEERDRQGDLQRQVQAASTTMNTLAEKADEYASLHRELEALYSSIFDGPTDSFPDEDKLEYSVHEARKLCELAEAQRKTESQTLKLLSQAVAHMADCHNGVEEALAYTSNSMWKSSSGQAYAMEVVALKNAQTHSDKAQNLLKQARKENSMVQDCGSVIITPGRSAEMDDAIANFYNPIDPEEHEKVKESAKSVTANHMKLKAEHTAASHREKEAERQLQQTSSVLKGREKELLDLRRAIFDNVVSSAPKPPTYSS